MIASARKRHGGIIKNERLERGRSGQRHSSEPQNSAAPKAHRSEPFAAHILFYHKAAQIAPYRFNLLLYRSASAE